MRQICTESSHVLTSKIYRGWFQILIRIRRNLPMCTLHGYKLRGVFHGQNNVPVERQEVIVPDAPPGSKTKLELAFTHPKLQFICRLMF